MTTQEQGQQDTHRHQDCCGTPMERSSVAPWSKWIFFGFLAIAAFYLWAEHRAHLLGFLPYLLFLACPLMHLFHGHHHKPKGE